MKKIRVQIFPEKTGDNISFFRNEDGKCTRLLKYLVLADGCDFFLVVALGVRKVGLLLLLRLENAPNSNLFVYVRVSSHQSELRVELKTET